jgi:hypothetical protein
VVEICHTYREANKCTDALATMGCFLSYDTVFYAHCPASVRDVYAADVQGSSTPRIIAL